jgi:hypothetical protein
MDKRGSLATRRSPGTFRCLPCKRTVTGTESGHCPNCGFVPPFAPELPQATRRADPLIVALVLVVAAGLIAYMLY